MEISINCYGSPQFSLISVFLSGFLICFVELFQICITCIPWRRENCWKRKKNSHFWNFFFTFLTNISCSSSILFKFSLFKIYRTGFVCVCVWVCASTFVRKMWISCSMQLKMMTFWTYGEIMTCHQISLAVLSFVELNKF